MTQLCLFSTLMAYEGSARPMSNSEIYSKVSKSAGISDQDLNTRKPIGRSQSMRSPVKQRIRWNQQALRAAGWLDKSDKRGFWELTPAGKVALTKHKPESDVCLVAFSTELGIAIWGNNTMVFGDLPVQISLCISSPPYPLRTSRAYGNVDTNKYTDFICEGLEPIVKNLLPGGSIALNVSNDIFLNGLPARSLYLEKLTIALVERLGLYLMDRLIWQSNKAPGPTYWACVNRVQLASNYEPIIWLTNNPQKVLSDNRRVLVEHTEQHKKLIARGGETRNASYCDGAHKIRPGDYGKKTEGRLHRNSFFVANTCNSQREYKRRAENLGLPTHGAPMPIDLAKFLIKFLAPSITVDTPIEERPLIVDHYGGSLTVGVAAEEMGYPWICADNVWEYLRGGAERFRNSDIRINPYFVEGGFSQYQNSTLAENN